MTDGLKRIEMVFQDFSNLLAHCRDKSISSMPDIQDTYNRLNRVRDRYLVEKKDLDPTERDVLCKALEKDNFITNMLAVRVIGEHVLRPEGATLSYPDNSTFSITSESSAAAVFKDPEPRLAAFNVDENLAAPLHPWEPLLAILDDDSLA